MAAPADHGLAALRDILLAVLQGRTDDTDLRKILFSKLMLMGEGRTGKTSLLKALLGQAFSKEEASTIGADTLDNIDAANWQPQKMHGMLGRNMAPGKVKTAASDARRLDAEMQRALYDAPLPDHGGARRRKHAGAGPAFEGQKDAASSKPASRPGQPTPAPPAQAGSVAPRGPPSAAASPQRGPPPPDAHLAAARPELTPAMTELAADAVLRDALADIEAGAATGDTVLFTIYDLGGQTVFYDLLQLLLSRYAIYLLCFNMGDFCDESRVGECINYMRFWLDSIAMYAPGASVFLVGTHRDMVPDQRTHEKISQRLVLALGIHDAFGAVVFPTDARGQPKSVCFFAVDNTRQSDAGASVSVLRTAIEKCASEQEYVKLAVPAAYLALVDSLKAHGRAAKTQRVDMALVEAHARRLGLDSAALDLALRVSHQFGLLLRFGNTVVLNAQWIVDSVAAVVRDHSFHANMLVPEAGARKSLDDLRRTGIVRANLFDVLWPTHTPSERGVVVGLMADLHMMVPLRALKESDLPSYLVPALLPPDLSGNAAPDALSNGLRDRYLSKVRYAKLASGGGGGEKADSCYFYFSRDQDLPDADRKFVELVALERTGFLPSGLFTRAVCEFVMHQQLTGGSRPDLSRQTMLVSMGAVEVQLDVVPHMFAIRMQTTTPTALPVVRRIRDIFAAILASTFPSVFMFVLLPYSDTVLLDLAVISQCTANKDSLTVQRRLVDILQLYSPFVSKAGAREDGDDVFVSYRHFANSMVVDKLVDAMYRETSRVTGTEIKIFYDQISLQLGLPLVDEFSKALAKALVAVPVMSTQAMERFTRQADAREPDNVLLEWLLMLDLADSGRLRRVLPLVLGDKFANPDYTAPAAGGEGSAPPPPADSVDDINKLKAWVIRAVPDATCPHTARELGRIRAMLGLPADRPVPTTRAAVLRLLGFLLMPLCSAQAAADRWAGSAKVHEAPATASGSTLGGWTALTQTGEKIRSVVDEELAKTNNPAARGPEARNAAAGSGRAGIGPTGPSKGPDAAAASRGAPSGPSPLSPDDERAAVVALLASKDIQAAANVIDILVKEALTSATALCDASKDDLTYVGIPMGVRNAIKKAFPTAPAS